MQPIVSRKNRKGRHIHIPEVNITKFVAVPSYPKGNRKTKTFEINDYLPQINGFHKKKHYDKARTKARKACEDFISKSENPNRYWVMSKALVTSVRSGIKPNAS